MSFYSKAKIGFRRDSNDAPLVRPENFGPQPKEKFKLRIADSTLVVVKAFLLGCHFDQTLGCRPSYVNVPWGDEILHGLDDDHFDLAIYNRHKVESYLAENPNSELQILGTVCCSMLGEHFSVITREDYPLEGESLEELRAALHGRTVIIGRDTDRYLNFLAAFNIDDQYLHDNNVTIVNIPEAGLEFLASMPQAIIVCGQNVRFQARIKGGFAEAKIFDYISDSVRSLIMSSSENVLISGPRFSKRAQEQKWLYKLTEEFGHSRAEHLLNDLIHELAAGCDFGSCTVTEERAKIARQVLAKTYGFGTPVWW